MADTKTIVITSDSHRRIDLMYKVLELHPSADYYIDLGDTQMNKEQVEKFKRKGWIMIEGNCDRYDVGLVKEEYIQINGVGIFMFHGDDYIWYGKYSRDLKDEMDAYREADYPINLCLHGHTHIFADGYLWDARFINPGSLGRPRESYNKKDYSLGTYMIMKISPDKEITYERCFINIYDD